MKHTKKTLRNVERKLIAEMWYYQLCKGIKNGCKIKTKDKQLMETIRIAYSLDKAPKLNVYWITCGKLAVIRWIIEDEKRYDQNRLSSLEDEFVDKFWYLTWYEKKYSEIFSKSAEDRSNVKERASEITEKYGEVDCWKHCEFEDFIICGKLAAIRWLMTEKWSHPDDDFEDDENSYEDDPLPNLDTGELENDINVLFFMGNK